jgi:hypothetical protein
MTHSESAQFKAIDLADAFHDRDAEQLDALDSVGRAGQQRAREALYQYVDQLWDTVKARARAEHGPDYNTADDPAYSGVAGMRDLLAELVATVHDAQVRADDDFAG